MDPLEKLRAALAHVRDNARYEADPRVNAQQIAAAWCEYFDATETAEPAPAPAPAEGA